MLAEAFPSADERRIAAAATKASRMLEQAPAPTRWALAAAPRLFSLFEPAGEDPYAAISRSPIPGATRYLGAVRSVALASYYSAD